MKKESEHIAFRTNRQATIEIVTKGAPMLSQVDYCLKVKPTLGKSLCSKMYQTGHNMVISNNFIGHLARLI